MIGTGFPFKKVEFVGGIDRRIEGRVSSVSVTASGWKVGYVNAWERTRRHVKLVNYLKQYFSENPKDILLCFSRPKEMLLALYKDDQAVDKELALQALKLIGYPAALKTFVGM